MTAARATSLLSKACRAGIFLALVAGACSERRQISLFGSPTQARDAGRDRDEDDDGDRVRRCETEDDCTSERPFCEGDRCVQCLITGNCYRGQSCRFEDHTCVATCLDNEDCAGGGRPICARAAGVCVECAGPSDCRDSDTVCDLRTGRCVGCLANEDCVDRLCHPALHDCVECVYDDDCQDSQECVRGECQR